MTGLETAAIIVAIVFMGVIMLTFIVILFAVLAATRKVTKLTRTAQAKVDMVKDIPYIGKRMFKAFKKK